MEHDQISGHGLGVELLAQLVARQHRAGRSRAEIGKIDIARGDHHESCSGKNVHDAHAAAFEFLADFRAGERLELNHVVDAGGNGGPVRCIAAALLLQAAEWRGPSGRS